MKQRVLNKVTTSTWPSGQYWQSLALEYFNADDLKVNFLKLNAYLILSGLWDEQKNVGLTPESNRVNYFKTSIIWLNEN